jgi:hypothetical protein
MTGKYPLSHTPTKKRMAYNWGTLVIEEVQKVITDQRISRVGISIDGRTRVANITAGIWPITYPAVKQFLA